MGGPCFYGGGTIEERLIDAEKMSKTDRYETLIQVVDLKDGTYLIYEKSNSRGFARITRVDAKNTNELAEREATTDELFWGYTNKKIIRKLNDNLIGG